MRLRVALVQHEAYDIDHCEEGLTRTLGLLDKASTFKPDLIVLPECSYPGYYLGLRGAPKAAAKGWNDALLRFRFAAERAGAYVAVGLPEVEGDSIYNSVFLISRDGSVVGSARKTFLWHFDRQWFSPGSDYRVFDTDIGRVGMIICADGRIPEITRSLTLKGAEIIVNATNWVTSGREPARLQNPQVDYMIPARAAENGVWFFCANKVGSEADTIVYCGQSIAVSPDGRTVAKGSPATEEILVVDADTSLSRRPAAMALRREVWGEDFRLLTRPNEDLPLARVLREPVVPGQETTVVAVAQVDRDISLKDYVVVASELAERLSNQGATLVVFPEPPCTTVRDSAELIRETFMPLSRRLGSYIALTAGRPSLSTLIFGPIAFGERAFGNSSDLLELAGLRVGFVRGKAGYVPEVGRALVLRGADLIVWQADLGSGYERAIAVTRALENRSYVALANCASKEAGRGANPADPRTSLLVAPDGRIVAETFPGIKQGVMGLCSASASRVKQLIWGTDVFRDRLPALYGDLALQEPAAGR